LAFKPAEQQGTSDPFALLDEALEYVAKDPMGCFWH